MRRLPLAVRLFTVVALCLAALAGCGSRRPRARDAGPPALPRPTLRFAFVTDVKGYLEPCGCTSRPLGGVHRLAGMLGRLGRDGVPTAFVAAGDMLLPGASSEAQSQQDRWQAETLVDVLNDLHAVAMVPGRFDRSEGDALLGTLRGRSSFPFIGVGPTAPLDLAPMQLVELGGTKVAFVGVTDAWETPNEALVAAAREAIATARGRGARLVVVLLRGDRRLARSVGMLDGVDFVVHGGLDAENPEPPTARGRAFVLEGGRQGQRVVVVDVYLRGGSAMRDESRFTRRVRRTRLQADLEERRAQIAAWERDGSASPADLEAQRAQVRSIEAEVRALDRDPDVASGNAFVADVIELALGVPEEAAIARRMEAFAIRANDHNRTALADELPPPAPAGGPTYVGSAACQSCHASAYRWWSQHLHGRAYQTLVDRHREYNLQCVACHVTGYGRPGGSTVTHNLEGALVNVGCESCHGPGSVHAQTGRGNIARQVPEGVCLGCHTNDHSDHFVYELYRQRILVPGHGLPEGTRR